MAPKATNSVVFVIPVWDDTALSLDEKLSFGDNVSLASIVIFVKLVSMSGRRRGVRFVLDPSDRIYVLFPRFRSRQRRLAGASFERPVR